MLFYFFIFNGKNSLVLKKEKNSEKIKKNERYLLIIIGINGEYFTILLNSFLNIRQKSIIITNIFYFIIKQNFNNV